VIQNVEFRLEGGRCGVLLIHGLTGTPTEMRLVGKGLNNAGFSVYGMQLAGHCGDVQDLLATSWKDWYASVEAAAEKYRHEVDHCSWPACRWARSSRLKLAAERPDWMRGVGVYGATFRYDGWAIPWYSRFSVLLPLMLKLGFWQNGITYETRTLRAARRTPARADQQDDAALGRQHRSRAPGNPWPSLAEMRAMAGGETRAAQSDGALPGCARHRR
jgi:carboxylesterase